uniref:Uncharacterized protein n=1 Tax=Arundo donax TaxID=35708 RepID=A0A0A9B640_ARUDO
MSSSAFCASAISDLSSSIIGSASANLSSMNFAASSLAFRDETSDSRFLTRTSVSWFLLSRLAALESSNPFKCMTSFDRISTFSALTSAIFIALSAWPRAAFLASFAMERSRLSLSSSSVVLTNVSKSAACWPRTHSISLCHSSSRLWASSMPACSSSSARNFSISVASSAHLLAISASWSFSCVSSATLLASFSSPTSRSLSPTMKAS